MRILTITLVTAWLVLHEAGRRSLVGIFGEQKRCGGILWRSALGIPTQVLVMPALLALSIARTGWPDKRARKALDKVLDERIRGEGLDAAAE